MLRIQEICKEKGMTMQELATSIGITYQALYACASGNPTIGKLNVIASALDVDIVDLFEREREKDENTITCPHCGGKIKIEKGESK
ncbi:helix-turn-helix transcriptional regulator [Bacteroides sp.]|uniref:helix-turn-helix domain-containing protein n=1 Tax=Bacteroides sp. TaxID=29523 RepID=UPI00260DD169|nr:helix-turn-helix transcriptional regulator [Bacteroides sp.]